MGLFDRLRGKKKEEWDLSPDLTIDQIQWKSKVETFLQVYIELFRDKNAQPPNNFYQLTDEIFKHFELIRPEQSVDPRDLLPANIVRLLELAQVPVPDLLKNFLNSSDKRQ